MCGKFEIWRKENLKNKSSKLLNKTCACIKQRLTNDPGYRHVGMLRRWWDSPKTMASDLMVLLGQRPAGYSLDRINTYGHYVPNNVRWSSDEVQRHNRISIVPFSLTAGQAYEIVIPQDAMSEAERQRRYARYRKYRTSESYRKGRRRYSKSYYRRNRERVREYQRKLYATDDYRLWHREYRKRRARLKALKKSNAV